MGSIGPGDDRHAGTKSSAVTASASRRQGLARPAHFSDADLPPGDLRPTRRVGPGRGVQPVARDHPRLRLPPHLREEVDPARAHPVRLGAEGLVVSLDLRRERAQIAEVGGHRRARPVGLREHQHAGRGHAGRDDGGQDGADLGPVAIERAAVGPRSLAPMARVTSVGAKGTTQGSSRATRSSVV